MHIAVFPYTAWLSVCIYHMMEPLIRSVNFIVLELCIAAASNMYELPLQALGESVLRKALEELQVWGLERRFTLYKYTSVAGTK